MCVCVCVRVVYLASLSFSFLRITPARHGHCVIHSSLCGSSLKAIFHMLSEISQAVRDNNYDLTFNWNIIDKEKNKQNITRDIEIKNNLTVTRGEVGQ